MAARVAILIANGVSPLGNVRDLLEGLGYTCIAMDSIPPDSELPRFDACVVGVPSACRGEELVRLSAKHPGSPFVYYLAEGVVQLPHECGVVHRWNSVSVPLTRRELELTIELAGAKRMQTLAKNFTASTPSPGHTQLNRATTEEQAWRALFEQLPNGVLLADRAGRILYANRAAGEMLGYDSQEFIGMRFHDLVPEDARPQVDVNIGRVLGGEVLITEAYKSRKDGSRHFVQLHETRVILPDGNPGILDVSIDISRAKQAEEALRESMEKYRILVENTQDGIIYAKNGEITYANPRIAEMLSISEHDLMGHSLMEFVHPEERSEILHRHEQRLRGNPELAMYEISLQNSRNEYIPVEINVSVVRQHDDALTIVVIRDIRCRKEAERAIRESEESYRGLFDNASEAIYILDPSGVFIDANVLGEKMYGYSKAELVGLSVEDISAPGMNNPAEANRKLEQAYRGSNQTLAFWGRKKNGDIVPNEVVLSRGDYFGLHVVMAIVRDISERKRAEAILRESEERLRTIIAAIPDQLFRISDNCLLIDFAPSEHPTYPALTGDMLGQSLRKIFPAEVFDKFNRAISACKRGASLETFDYQVSLSGGINHYETRIVPSGSNTFLVLQRDITQSKKAEEEVRMLAQVVTNVRDSISITDLNNNFLYVNPAFISKYGYTREEILGKNASLLKPANTEATQDSVIVEETIRRGWQGELMNVTKDGSIFPISLSTSCAFGSNGQPMALVGIANDISDRKRAERELIEAKERAEESDRLKTAFLSNMSHEIRSPMNAVMGFIQLIKAEEQLSEMGQQYVDLIQNSGNQLLSLIEDILDISKIQSNQLRLVREQFDLNQLLEELFLVFSAQLRASENTPVTLLRPELGSPSPFNVYSDPVRVRQVLTNLLSNAIKFTPTGNVSFGYTLITNSNSSRVQCFVKDTGIGIPCEAQTLIFERFRQADDSFTRLYGGSGLGLAISKGLVELLGGHIWVESQEGEGSEFYFSIPYSAKGQGRVVPPKPAPKQGDAGGFLLKDKTILVVDSTKDSMASFERMEARTIFASTAREARKLFKEEESIDLVLLDVQLPDADGYDLIKEFKRIKPNVWIVAQTAFAMQSELNRCIESGCDDYVAKPLNPELLLNKVGTLIG